MTEPEELRQHSGLYRAATATFDFKNPSRALSSLLALANELLSCERAVLYEYDESKACFRPRLAHGVAVGDLGLLSAAVEHEDLQAALSSHKAFATDGERSSLSLPLGPGVVACAPCVAAGETIGLIFLANSSGEPFSEEALATLETLASRASELLAFARQSANQSYLFHKLSLLYQASHAIAATRDRHETIRQTATHLLKAISAEVCEALILTDASKSVVRFRHQEGRAVQQTTPDGQGSLPAYPAHKEVLKTLRPARLSVAPAIGTAKDIALLQSEDIASAAIFPLATRNRAHGLIRLVFTKPGHQISDQEMELANAITSIGAVGLQNALSLETAQSTASQLQVLSEIGRAVTSTLDLEAALRGAMDHAQSLLGVEACILFLLDEEGQKLVIKASGGSQLRLRDVAIGLDEGIAGWVTQNRRPMLVNDVHSNPLYHSGIDGQTGLLTSSILCVPLETRGQVLGVIEAINHPRNAFGEAEQQMLSSVASWAAIAVDNASLFRRVAEEHSRLEATLVETADAVVLTDPSGRIFLMSKAAGKAFGLSTEKVVGRHASEVFSNQPLGDLLTSDGLGVPTSLEITTPTDRVLHASLSEIPDVGRVAVMQDITALKQIDHMRSQLLGTAAHDLKNPLNAIRLGADLLNDAQLSDQQRKALNMMQRATDSMTNLITGLLETIRVESTANLILEPCLIDNLIRRAIEDIRPLSDEKQHTMEYRPFKQRLVTMGNPSRLSSVMRNLLSNAVKFTDPGGHIQVETKGNDEEIIISVSDNGPGIHEDEIPRVFEHLFRGRAAVRDPSNPVEGTGLGLALAKTVVEQHGGRIWVTSKEKQGSTFFVSLPREQAPGAGAP
ncbi:MAG: GAF domain-containing protein [Anaerolineales bacterium]|jgi:PAS domain S-box-containing protein